MLASGIDIVDLDRFARAIERHGERFCRRIFTSQELRFCAGHVNRLAGRFAVKEAVAKALGTGIGDFGWTDVEVVCDGRGRPELVLHNNALVLADSKGLTQWSVSISHTNDYAVGLAVAGSA